MKTVLLGRGRFARVLPGIAVLVLSTALAAAQSFSRDITLEPSKPAEIKEAGFTLVLEQVTEDSRCPADVTCIWAGDAAARIRIETTGAKPSTYTLRLNAAANKEIEHGGVRVRLTALAPYPTEKAKPRPEDYRATFHIERK